MLKFQGTKHLRRWLVYTKDGQDMLDDLLEQRREESDTRRILLVLKEGAVEVYADREVVALAVNFPDVETPEGEIEAEKIIEMVLPLNYRSLYWPHATYNASEPGRVGTFTRKRVTPSEMGELLDELIRFRAVSGQETRISQALLKILKG